MNWDESCDVLVVGSGAGGLTGAYAAARAGLSTILIESSDRFGGTSAYSGGGMWFPGNAVLRRGGGDHDFASARAYYHEVVGNRTPRDLQDAYLDTGAELIEFLEEDPDLAFIVHPWPDYFGALPTASATGRHIAPAPLPAASLGALRNALRPTLGEERSGMPLADELVAGQALVGRFLLALSKRSHVDLQLNAALTQLVEEDGKVLGAVIRCPAGHKRVKAGKGVLIAAGGFDHDAAMRERFGVPGTVSGAMSPPSNDGAAIKAGMAAGGAVDLMDQAWWSPGLMRPDGRSTFTLGFDGGVFVDQDGQRFMNESMPYDRSGREIIARMEQDLLRLPFWLVYDNRDDGAPPIQFPNQPIGELDDYRAAGLLRSGATLPLLAAAIGVPAVALVATADRVNEQVACGIDDDFGRGAEPYDRVFTEGRLPMDRIDRAPFHAMAFGLSDLGTKGGLRTDRDARVLDSSGSPIAGLYAAGNSMAAVSGTAYPAGGNPIGSGMVFAYRAANHMACDPERQNT
ncbi:FAD-binding protein [Croceicoccus sp. F390]|uniref:FAD-binding protein n=1 Tax=Croceicoccus esteveae TaxID=3075597 RepID=A0ABU2ZKD4_9SPHN|nr:FAD-binding protein [Croceicoccus sp. F390]MDT0577076.1 FAD-binding protein [Croceicoccus sp. F390]